MQFSLTEVHPSWHEFFKRHLELIENIFTELDVTKIAPERELVFRAFREPLENVKVAIFGQDPYPTPGVANGLAFSVAADAPLPASLRNIFKEYCSDLSLPTPSSGDLSEWSSQGVLLVNRVLTTDIGERNAHRDTSWISITEDLARYLGARGVVAILWGSSAHELAKYFHNPIMSVHPSPLSAYRGFFGSRPFSKANLALVERGLPQISWKLR